MTRTAATGRQAWSGRRRRSHRRPHRRECQVTTETIQILTPEGERTDHPEYPLGDVDIRGMYRDMVLVRRIDTEAVALQRQGELGLWPPLLGQEAAQIGSGRALSPRDMAFPSYREHGVAWCRGLDPLRILELFRGVNHGGWDPEEHKFHLYTIVIGDQTLHATGYAMGIKNAAAGDEAAIAAPAERQSRAPIYQRASGFGFPGVQVDGNDVLACYAVTKHALRAAREGQGPMLIEAFTYRMGAHTTTDDPTRYRLSSELEAWRLRDPIERVRSYLARTGEADSAFFDEVNAAADAEAARLRAACLALPDPGPLALFDNVYAGPHQILDAERAQYAAYLAGFDDADAAVADVAVAGTAAGSMEANR